MGVRVPLGAITYINTLTKKALIGYTVVSQREKSAKQLEKWRKGLTSRVSVLEATAPTPVGAVCFNYSQ